jgi:hypothetical protein
MNVRSSLLLIASALSLAGANCDGGEPPAPDAGVIVADPCSEDADCTGGLRCSTNGLCESIPACSLDDECRAYEYCSVSEGICRTRDGFGSDCIEDSECGLNSFCALGKCRDSGDALPCARRADCPVGFDCDRVHFYCIESVGCTLAEQFPETACEPDETCNELNGRCQRAGAAECTVETQADDCQIGMFCDPVGNCVQCTSDQHCGSGLQCNVRSGLCESDNICRTDADCPDPDNQMCDPQARICIPRPDPCTSDLHCGFAESCNVVTGLCEPIGGPCRDDIYEDNDTFASATDAIFEGQQLIMDHLTLCPDDNDFYAVRLNRGEEISVQAMGMDDGAMLDLSLVAQDGISTLRYAPGPPRGPAGFSFVAGADAFYFIKVAHLAGNTPYELHMNLAPGQACDPDNFEGEGGNDQSDLASILNPGNYPGVTLCQFDVDYYQIDLAAGHALEFIADFNHQAGDIDLRLLSLDGTTELDASRGVRADRERIFYRSAHAQSLLVEVRALDHHALPYTLTLNNHGPYQCSPDADEGVDSNNFANLATQVQLPDALRNARSLCAADVDWYRLTVGANQRVYATASYETREAQVAIQFYAEDGVNPLGRDWTAEGQTEAVFASIRTTTVLAKISAADDGIGPYDLQFSSTVNHHCRPDAYEPNDSAESASALATDANVSAVACDGDDDWYRIDVRRGQRLRIGLDFHAVDGDLDMALLIPDRSSVMATSEGVQSHEEIEMRFPSSGSYYLRIYSIDTRPEAGYNLTLTELD